MAFFSPMYAIKLYLLLVVACSCVLAGTKTSLNGYASPYVLVRLKRSPHRAFTFSGFDPTNGMAAFATSADFLPYYQYPSSLTHVAYPQIESRGETYAPTSNTLATEYKEPSADFKPPTSSEYQPPSVDYKPPSSDYTIPSVEYNPPSAEYKPPAGVEFQPTSDYTSSSASAEDEKTPTLNLTPPSEQAPSGSYDPSPAPAAKKPKKKPVAVTPEDDEDEVGNSKSKSSSSASFNAWFPIMLGMYPSVPQFSKNVAAESYKDAFSAPVKEHVPAGGLGTTVIANSVSHGKSSVASSHAIAYGGEAPLQSYSRPNKA